MSSDGSVLVAGISPGLLHHPHPHQWLVQSLPSHPAVLQPCLLLALLQPCLFLASPWPQRPLCLPLQHIHLVLSPGWAVGSSSVLPTEGLSWITAVICH